MDLGRDQDWLFICNCEKIRDCLLHTNGQIDLSRDKIELEKIVTQSNGMLAINASSIEIKGEFLQELNKVSQRFISKIKAKVET